MTDLEKKGLRAEIKERAAKLRARADERMGMPLMQQDVNQLDVPGRVNYHRTKAEAWGLREGAEQLDQVLALLTALVLVLVSGCGSSVVVEHCDAGAEASVDAAASEASGITALGACMWVEGIYRQKTLEGTLDPDTCPLADCPFPFPLRPGPVTVTCDAADVEACAWELERANTCPFYQAAIASCVAESCR